MLLVDLVYGRPHQEPLGPMEYANRLRHRLAAAYNMVRTTLQGTFERTRRYYSGRGHPFETGSKVWLYTPVHGNKKLNSGWTGPWEVVQQETDVLVSIRSLKWNRSKVEITVPIDRIKQYYAAKDPQPHSFQLSEDDVQTSDEFLEQGVTKDEELARRH